MTYGAGHDTFTLTVGTAPTTPTSYAGGAPTASLSGENKKVLTLSAENATKVFYVVSDSAAAIGSTGITNEVSGTITLTTVDHDGKYIHVIAQDANGYSAEKVWQISATDPSTTECTITPQ